MHRPPPLRPGQLMFRREIRTEVPQLRKTGMTKGFILARPRQEAPEKRIRRRAVSSPVKEGDKVLLQQPSRDKFSTRYDPLP